MENIEGIKLNNQIISREQKVVLVEKVLSLMEKMPDMVVSGSFSLAISNSIHDKKVDINNLDLDSIRDLDVGSMECKTHSEIDELAILSKEEGFEIDNNNMLTPSLYYEEGKAIALETAEIEFNNKKIAVRYTTPAYLLTTVCGETGGPKVSVAKKINSIEKITTSPSFCADDFIKLAKHEIGALDKMNENTFEYWKKTLKIDNEIMSIDLILQEADYMKSLVDMDKLKESLEKSQDVSKISFNQVRIKTELEKFLEDFEKKITSS